MNKFQIILISLLISCFFIMKFALAHETGDFIYATKYFSKNSPYEGIKYNAWVKLKEKMGQKENFSKADIELIYFDLNDDKITDFIAAVDSKKCSNCLGLIILSHKYPPHKPKNFFDNFVTYAPSYYEYFDTSFIKPDISRPVHIYKNKTHNSREIVINDANFIYDGKKYRLLME